MLAQPSEHQKELWWKFIVMKDDPVPVGESLVWMGWCPLCDEKHDKDAITARFDFKRGLLYCENGEGGRSCHGKRSMSLSNVLVRMEQSGQR
jgi:hypothetical protein